MLKASRRSVGIHPSELSCRCYYCFRCCPSDSGEAQAACSVAAGCCCHPTEVDDYRRHPEVAAGCHHLAAGVDCHPHPAAAVDYHHPSAGVDCHHLPAVAGDFHPAAADDSHLAAAVCHPADAQADAMAAVADESELAASTSVPGHGRTDGWCSNSPNTCRSRTIRSECRSARRNRSRSPADCCTCIG